MIILSLLLNAAIAAPPCHTLSHFEPTSFRSEFPPPPPSGEKESMDVFSLPNAATSDNFALRWGGGRAISEERAQEILTEFERAWDHEINTLNFPAPLGSDAHLFNVYIGNSGSGAPSSYGAAGYYDSDASGWPMIVIDLETLDAAGSYGVIPHEFFHAVQHACDTFSYDGESAWYWESTAIWIENEVYPEDPNYALFLFGFAFLPHKSLHFFDYADSGATSEYYQYGAFIFPKFLSTFHAQVDDVRDSWVDSSWEQTPLGWWEEFFGTEIYHDLVFEFAQKNVYWDYPHKEWYEYYLDYYSEYFPQDDQSITESVNSFGAASWDGVDDDLMPEHLGVNYIELSAPEYSQMELGIVGDEAGDQGTPVSWRLGLVRKSGDQITYQDLGSGEPQVIEGITSSETLTLVVMPIAPDTGWGEQFSYEYLFVKYEEEVSEPEDETPKSACSTMGAFDVSLFLSIVGLVVARRRY